MQTLNKEKITLTLRYIFSSTVGRIYRANLRMYRHSGDVVSLLRKKAVKILHEYADPAFTQGSFTLWLSSLLGLPSRDWVTICKGQQDVTAGAHPITN